MPYQPTVRELRPVRDRRRLEAALRARNLSGSELSRLVTALGAPASKQAISHLRHGRTRSVRAELADAIERVLAVEPGHLFGIEAGTTRDGEEW